MKILCYGAGGWIGEQIRKLLEGRAHIVVCGTARLDRFQELCAEIDSVKPEYVFSSVGRTHGTHSDGRVFTTIDFLEMPGNLDLNLRDNLIGPLNLARACQLRNLVCGYMGTGCIFEYDAQHQSPTASFDERSPIDCTDLVGFVEEDRANFKGSSYSIVKGWTDDQMRLFKDTVCNWRIRMPISAADNSRDFITKICTYGKTAKVCSVANSMTVLPEILPIMVSMIENRTTGTFNMCNPGLITHNQILTMYQRIIDPQFTYQNFTVEEQAKILKAGRSNNYLATQKLEDYCRDHNLKLTPIFAAIESTLKKRK